MNNHLTLVLAAMLAFPVSALAKQPIPTNAPAAGFQPDDVCSGRVGGGNRSHNGCGILPVLTEQHGAGVHIEVAFDGSEPDEGLLASEAQRLAQSCLRQG